MAEEEKFITELQTKSSPNFHKFLSPEEWNARFGPSVEDEQKVVDWATSEGLTVTNRFANRLLVDVEAPSGVIEKVFGLTINNYKVRDEVDFANDRDPQIPASLSGILVSVQGLNSIQRFRRVSNTTARKGLDYVPGPVFNVGAASHGDGDATKAPGNRSTAKEAGGIEPRPQFTNGHADPADIPFSSQSYDYNALYAQGHCCNPHGDSGGSPAVSSIALVTYGNFQSNDVNTFFQTYGMAWDWNAYAVDGTNNPGTECNVGASGCPGDGQDDEAPLDVEYSTATANSFGSYLDTAHVYVYEASNGLYSTYEDVFNFIASDNHAKVVSTSYGGSESDFENGNGIGIFSTMHGIFNTMVGEGFTLIASSGDNGASDDCSNQDRVGYPAADPDFVGAGGTRISFNSDGTFSSEVAWTGVNFSYPCGNNWGGGGGGVSTDFSQPSYQSGLGGSQRLVPDISMNADPYGTEQNYYYNGGLQGVGGTSIVAPELAGFFAQENSYLNAIGNICGSGSSACTPIGNPNPFVYEEGKNKNAQHDPFYDVTSGCNSNYYTTLYGIGSYCAGTGYDEATGWGSINALQLAWALNWEVIPAYGIPYVTFTGPATNTWYNTNQTVSWTIHDYVPSGAPPGTGIAGESQGWDSIPADPSSEATPGSGNSFYDGPEFKNDATGCLALQPNGCSGGVSQGCHTAYARGWNNQGFSTAGQSGYPESYGPICYDTVAPTIGASISPTLPASGWYRQTATITLTGADPGGSNASGLARIYYNVNNSNCQPTNTSYCYSGSSPIFDSFSAQGIQTVTSFTEDNAGNFSNVATSTIKIDETAPVSSVGLSGNLVGNTWESAVGIALSATDSLSGVAATYYTLDGGATIHYSGYFTVSTVGSHTLKFWSVDVAGNTESTNTDTFTVTSPTTATLTTSLNPSVNGQTVTMTATITPSLIGTPTGTVTFKNGATIIGNVALSGGTASLNTSTLPLGTDSLTATYNGATYFLGSSAALSQSVYESTSTIIKPSVNPSTLGNSVTFTATVKASISGIPAGTVQFRDGITVLGTATLNASGVATFATSAFSVGSNAMNAVYLGNATYYGSTSPSVIQTVDPASSSIVVKSSANPSIYGASVTLTATVSSAAGTPTGTVTFLSNGVSLGTGTLTNGVTTLATTKLAGGKDNVTASYAKSADFNASLSPVLSQTVSPAASKSAVTASINPSNLGSPVTFTATVTSTAGTPTGVVTFLSDGVSLGTGNLANGVATLGTRGLAVGKNSITVSYGGSADFAVSTSPVFYEVTNSTTTTAVSASPSPSTFGSPVTLTAKVTSASGTPTGVVTFLSNGVSLGTAPVLSGTATLATRALAVGKNAITASYGGAAGYGASTSPAIAEVTNSSTTTVLTASPNPQTTGLAVTLTATVTAASTGPPSGTVTFLYGTTSLGTGTLTGGVATLSTTVLPKGTDKLTATFAASGYFLGSTSAAINVSMK